VADRTPVGGAPARLRGGYFERPRAETQSDIATELGIGQETVSRHLRAVQRRLLRVAFDETLLADGDGDPVD
jgi:DNA-binding transcriptional regulator LsrR (DeoR family)